MRKQFLNALTDMIPFRPQRVDLFLQLLGGRVLIVKPGFGLGRALIGSGAREALPAAKTGSGNAFRSSLPDGVTGTSSMTVIAAGTM